MKVKIIINGIEIRGELFDTPTAKKVYQSLPLESEVNRWGDEIYFYVPVEAELEEDAREEQEVGNICFWTAGKAIAIFFGSTPVSVSGEPRAIEPVNLIGRITGDVSVLRKTKDGDRVRVERG
jgi:hypothetical protein